MCGYGGYLDIARLLLDHGADLENVDVDGDNPEISARNRGHANIIILFQEERERLSRVSGRAMTRLSLARDTERLATSHMTRAGGTGGAVGLAKKGVYRIDGV